MDNKSILAIILLVLFTIEIIFIFTYMPSEIQDTDIANKDSNVAPPPLPPPVPPIRLDDSDYEFDGDFNRPHFHPHHRHGRFPHHRHHKHKHELTRIHFFIVKNMKNDNNRQEVEIKPKFDRKLKKQKYKLKIPNADDNKLLVADYRDIHSFVKYKLMDDDEIIQKGNGKGGRIKLGRLKDLKKYKNLTFEIKDENM